MHVEHDPRLQRERWDTSTLQIEIREDVTAAIKLQRSPDMRPFLQHSGIGVMGEHVFDSHMQRADRLIRHSCRKFNRSTVHIPKSSSFLGPGGGALVLCIFR